MTERFSLVYSRIGEMAEESLNAPEFEAYFTVLAGQARDFADYYLFVAEGGMDKAGLSELKAWNEKLYGDILPEHYGESYANPAYAAARLGSGYGPVCSAMAAELRSMIVPAAQGCLEAVLRRLELFVEFFGAFTAQAQESGELPKTETLRRILYWYVSDYSDVEEEAKIRSMVCPENCLSAEIIREADLTGPEYLYRYGEYVSENEIETAAFLAGLAQETINLMADTYTEGYRIGFELGGKDLSRKGTVELVYSLGFERMMRRAAENFEKLGLQPVIRRTPAGLLQLGSLAKRGAIGGNPNKQYDFDHKDDKALIWDKAMVQRKEEVFRTAFEAVKEEARLYAGPAVLEIFGEKPFAPESKKEALSLSPEQQRLWVEYRTRIGQIQREYISEEERSFTIIAFPVPEIGEGSRERFRGIFEDIIRINTLDYMKYRRIQQKLIDALDRADRVEVLGMKGNRTRLTVNLHKLQDPARETIFENCVADVNIPVGEVFTSPVLAGTNGVLHVSRVYLNELEYKDLEITFQEGMISDYRCGNFPTQEENRKYIKENILYHRETLPIGEFAIGTNTTAYVCAKKWGIEGKLPILIAEKTGPHFAVGDTCYSHAEDVRVYNPDGKEIVARENEVAAKRHTDPAGAYFDCHTDITIPYDELGELTAVQKDGMRIPIIREGRFVLPGTEELNEPFEGISG